MKNGMRIFCILLCAAMLLGCLGTAAAEGANIFEGVEFTETAFDGFLIPTPTGNGWTTGKMADRPDGIQTSKLEYEPNKWITVNAYWYESTSPNHFAEDPEVARKEMESDMAASVKNSKSKDAVKEFTENDGHPVGLMTLSANAYGQYLCQGRIIYIRNNRYLLMTVETKGNSPESVRPITMDELKLLASKIRYDESQAPFTADKAKFKVTCSEYPEGMEPLLIATANTLQMNAVFEDTELVNKQAKNDGVTWSVVRKDSGEEVPGITISNKGQVKGEKKLTTKETMTVKARSDVYGTEASCDILVLPIASKASIEPADMYLYLGSDTPQTARIVLEPAAVPIWGVLWYASKDGIVQITPAEETWYTEEPTEKTGTAEFRPLAAGKTAVTVLGAWGKPAKMNVSVVEPVEAVELTVKGNVKPGGSVTVTAVLQPKTAGNKNVEWSLDVGEDIATIDAKGKVKISKDAASGTKITVTCKALGAPEPVTATTVIEIP